MKTNYLYLTFLAFAYANQNLIASQQSEIVHEDTVVSEHVKFHTPSFSDTLIYPIEEINPLQPQLDGSSRDRGNSFQHVYTSSRGYKVRFIDEFRAKVSVPSETESVFHSAEVRLGHEWSIERLSKLTPNKQSRHLFIYTGEELGGGLTVRVGDRVNGGGITFGCVAGPVCTIICCCCIGYCVRRCCPCCCKDSPKTHTKPPMTELERIQYKKRKREQERWSRMEQERQRKFREAEERSRAIFYQSVYDKGLA